jgi:hypothetical protein
MQWLELSHDGDSFFFFFRWWVADNTSKALCSVTWGFCFTLNPLSPDESPGGMMRWNMDWRDLDLIIWGLSVSVSLNPEGNDRALK